MWNVSSNIEAWLTVTTKKFENLRIRYELKCLECIQNNLFSIASKKEF